MFLCWMQRLKLMIVYDVIGSNGGMTIVWKKSIVLICILSFLFLFVLVGVGTAYATDTADVVDIFSDGDI